MITLRCLYKLHVWNYMYKIWHVWIWRSALCTSAFLVFLCDELIWNSSNGLSVISRIPVVHTVLLRVSFSTTRRFIALYLFITLFYFILIQNCTVAFNFPMLAVQFNHFFNIFLVFWFSGSLILKLKHVQTGVCHLQTPAEFSLFGVQH